MKRISFNKNRERISKAIAAIFIAALAPGAYSQIEHSLKFIPEKVDFGRIREENGKVTRKVKAINITQDSTFIISARTSCGCSAAEYPQDVIAPGDTVEVSVSYDPHNRPGKFLKTARFFTGHERIGNSIKLCGNVIPSKKNLERSYPEKIGDLRLSTLLINAGELTRREARPLFVGLYNDSDRSLPLLAATDSNALEAALLPDTIEPYGISTVTLMLKCRNIPDHAEEIFYNAFLINAESGDTITAIPIGGIVKTQNN